MPNDPRNKTEQYSQERIPGAKFFDIDLISDRTTNLPHMLPSLAEWTEHMKKFNIGVNDTVICYDDYSILGSSRAWWTMKVFGIKNCWILNANFAKWKNEGLQTEKGSPKIDESSSVRPAEDFNFTFNQGLVKNMKDIRKWVNSPTKNYELVDARAPGRYSGAEPDPRGKFSIYFTHIKNFLILMWECFFIFSDFMYRFLFPSIFHKKETK